MTMIEMGDPTVNNSDVDSGNSLSSLIAVLAGQIRIEILRELAGGPMCVTDLAESLQLDVSSVSHHLVILKKAGFVTVQRINNSRMYAVGGIASVDVESSGVHINALAPDGAWIELQVPSIWLPALQGVS